MLAPAGGDARPHRLAPTQVAVSCHLHDHRDSVCRPAGPIGLPHLKLKPTAIAILFLVIAGCGTSAPSGQPLSLMTVQTSSPGCPSAALGPVRVVRNGDALAFQSVGTGQDVTVAWPSGFAALVTDGLARLYASDGQLIATEGDVLDNLGGSQNLARSAFVVCSVGDKIYG